MVGLIPRSGFVTDLQKVRMKEMGELFTPAQIKKHLRDRRYMMLYNFSKAGKNASKQVTENDDVDAPVTRSSVDDNEDWVVDLDAAEGKVTDIRRLDRYCIEQLIPLPLRSNILLLAKVDE